MRRKRSGLNFNKQRKKFNLPLFKEVLVWITETAITLLLAFVFVYFFGLRISVVGQAMGDTLAGGDQVFVNRFIYNLASPKPNDIVVFLPNGNEKSHYYVRRVVAVPGDTVQVLNGAVYVNGEMFEEEADVPSIEEAGLAEEEITLGTDEYFVLGDNRNNSEDSRYANIGNVKKEYMEGKAWFWLRSFGKMGFL